MGYDVRITRKARWFDDAGPIITEVEWRNFVDSHADLSWFDNVGGRADTGVKVLGVEDQNDATIWWEPGEGSVRTKNPRGGLLRRMAEFAHELDAVVMGDEGETYHLPDNINVPIPFFDDPSNTENIWRMPTADEIKDLDRKHAKWVDKIRAQAASTPHHAQPRQKRFTWKLALAVVFILLLVWNLFNAPHSVMNP